MGDTTRRTPLATAPEGAPIDAVAALSSPLSPSREDSARRSRSCAVTGARAGAADEEALDACVSISSPHELSALEKTPANDIAATARGEGT